MAKVIAAYIGHGRRFTGRRARQHEYVPDADLLLGWQRLYCLFAVASALSNENDKPRMILITDHQPPAVNGRMVGFHLSRLGVEMHQVHHAWRPFKGESDADYFIFDALEHLSSIMHTDDQLLLFSSRALIINPLEAVFAELQLRSALFVEDSYGDLEESHDRALRERMAELRRAFGIGFPDLAVRAASPDFLGLTYSRLTSILDGLRKLFMKNILRASRDEDHFVSAAEVLAALFACEQFYHPDLTGLSDHAAAMPDDFSATRLADIPVVIPGYGREPDIAALFDTILGDRLHASLELDRDHIFHALRNEPNAQRKKSRFASFSAFMSVMRRETILSS